MWYESDSWAADVKERCSPKQFLLAQQQTFCSHSIIIMKSSQRRIIGVLLLRHMCIIAGFKVVSEDGR